MRRHEVARLVEALSYKPEVRGFDSPMFTLWPPRRRREMLWLLVNLVIVRTQKQRELKLQDFTKRSKWKLYQSHKREDSVGNYLSVVDMGNVTSPLTLNIPSLARQRCLPSWGPRRTPWFFCNFPTIWCGRLLKLCFFGGVSETIIQWFKHC